MSAFSAHHVPGAREMRSSQSHPDHYVQLGAQALSVVLRIAPKRMEFYSFIYLFISFLSLTPPHTPVLAVTENNGFVGGFKMSDRENKHRCSLCSEAGNGIKAAEIKEWGRSSSSSSKAITTCEGKPWQLKESWNLAYPWSCSYYYNTA